MKTLRKEKFSFEIDLPEEWALAPAAAMGVASIVTGPIPKGIPKKELFQYGCYNEAFNFEIGPLFPEPLLSDTEREFSLYAHDMGFRDVIFGRIIVGGKEHVCAHYYIADKMGIRWNKKYMIVFGGAEYTITGTSNDPQWFAQREKDWDAIIKTFRLLAPIDDTFNATEKAARYRQQRREIIDQRIGMRETAGDLYAKAYEAVVMGQFVEARGFLEECLRDNPDHVLAHKELAVVLKKLGNIKGTLHHHKEVKRLAPGDLINRANLVELLAASGKRGESLNETRESLKIAPNHPMFRSLEEKLLLFRYADYRILFLSSLICLLLTDMGLWTGGWAVKDVWCFRLFMLMPVGIMYISGPWVGVPKIISGLIAGVLYLLLLK